MSPPFTLLPLATQCMLHCSCVNFSSALRKHLANLVARAGTGRCSDRHTIPLVKLHTALITYAYSVVGAENPVLAHCRHRQRRRLLRHSTPGQQQSLQANFLAKLAGTVVLCTTVPGSWQDQPECLLVCPDVA